MVNQKKRCSLPFETGLEKAVFPTIQTGLEKAVIPTIQTGLEKVWLEIHF